VESALDEVMPHFEANEVHSVWVLAPPPVVYAAIKAVTPREIRLFAPLMAIRGLPSSVRGRRTPLDPSAALLDQFVGHGFLVLDDRPASELVLGAIGRFWRLVGNGELRRVGTREEFVAFAEPGYAKAAVNFAVSTAGAGSRLVTETRVLCTDAVAARRFRRYWLVIRLGSGGIRRSWLAAIRRRAERLV
jgi:hypothetical protein